MYFGPKDSSIGSSKEDEIIQGEVLKGLEVPPEIKFRKELFSEEEAAKLQVAFRTICFIDFQLANDISEYLILPQESLSVLRNPYGCAFHDEQKILIPTDRLNDPYVTSILLVHGYCHARMGYSNLSQIEKFTSEKKSYWRSRKYAVDLKNKLMGMPNFPHELHRVLVQLTFENELHYHHYSACELYSRYLQVQREKFKEKLLAVETCGADIENLEPSIQQILKLSKLLNSRLVNEVDSSLMMQLNSLMVKGPLPLDGATKAKMDELQMVIKQLKTGLFRSLEIPSVLDESW